MAEVGGLGPEEAEALRAALAAAEARAALAEARVSDDAALIAHLRLEIAKLKRDRFGQRSERTQRLLDQYELQLEELEASATADELAAEKAAARTTTVEAFTRRRPSRQPFPEHLPRERVVVAAPTVCLCSGGARLSKLGEDVTETLEVIPRQWKVVQTVRERFSCRDCERIAQAPAPFHVTPRGWAGPSLLAMILFEKFGQHQPLNRQAERYAREGVPLSLSTLADQVGACAVALQPLFERLQAHVLGAERLHGDDTTVPVLARGKTDTGRRWVYIRDDRPFGGPAPPATLFHYSRDRRGEHPAAHLAGWSGILQADAYAGYNTLYARAGPPIPGALCWAHARRYFYELADAEAVARRKARGAVAVASPIALEAVRRMDALFDIERALNGRSAPERLAARQEHSAPLVADLHDWLRAERAKLSRGTGVAVPIDYMLKRWAAFTRFLDDGRVCLSNNAAERALRGLALGRRAWLFAGSDRPPRGVLLQPDHDRQAQRRRPAGLARRRTGPHRQPSSPSPRRVPAVELGAYRRPRSGRLTRQTVTAALTGRVLNVAEGGEEAVQAARLRDYDVILMDVQMPVMDGGCCQRCACAACSERLEGLARRTA